MSSKFLLQTIDDWWKLLSSYYKKAGFDIKTSSGIVAGSRVTAANINELITKLNGLNVTTTGDKKLYFSYADWSNSPASVQTQTTRKEKLKTDISSQLTELEKICVNNAVTSNTTVSNTTCSFGGTFDSTFSNTGTYDATTSNLTCVTEENSTAENITNATDTTYNAARNANCTINSTGGGKCVVCLTYGVLCTDDEDFVTYTNSTTQNSTMKNSTDVTTEDSTTKNGKENSTYTYDDECATYTKKATQTIGYAVVSGKGTVECTNIDNVVKINT